MIFPYHSATRVKCVLPSTTPVILLLQVWPLALSLATTRAISFDFSSSSYLDVSVRRVPSTYLCIQYAVTILLIVGLPHSEICGSMLICSSPQLIAAYHVLPRLQEPRHPSCALFSFPCFFHSLTLFLEFRSIYFSQLSLHSRRKAALLFWIRFTLASSLVNVLFFG